SVGIFVVLIPVVGALVAAFIVRAGAEDRRIKGVSDLVETVTHRQGRLNPRKVSSHALATAVSVGSGGSAGREGIIVQFGAVAGSLVSAFGGVSVRERKTLLAAGAAGAIAATFNTPIAGIIFAIEVVLLEFRTRSFVPLAVSSVAATAVAVRFLGDQPSFPVPTFALVSPYEFPLYALLGVLAGLLAGAELGLLERSQRWFARVPGPWWLAPAAGGALVGAVAFWVPGALGIGYEWVRVALVGGFTLPILLILAAAKLISFAITKGSGGASGGFSPSLFMGAMAGGAFGIIVHGVFPTVTATSGAYALVGMAAVYAGVTRASLTAIVMLFEMTRNFEVVLPVILAVVLAEFVAKSFVGGSLYARHGVAPTENDMAVNILDLVSVEQIMSKKVEAVKPSMTLREVVDRSFSTGHQGFPVVNLTGDLVGIITTSDLRRKVKPSEMGKLVKDVMTRDLVVATPGESAHRALTRMVTHGIGHLPVVDPDERTRLVGFLTRSDVVDVEKRALAEEAKSEPRDALRAWLRREG
ncbi:MAG: chloride channel protein, partial [Thermoplasmatota archaeon]